VNVAATQQRAHLAREVVETLLFVGLVFFIIHVTVQTNRVEDTTMAPQLKPGQSFLVNKAAYFFGGPSHGDVVVFTSPCSGDASQPLIGRVIAVPGDTVQYNATGIQVNNVQLNEPYVHLPEGTAEFATVLPPTKLADNQYFILDDNRINTSGTPASGGSVNCQNESDSRTFGSVPRQNIQGKAVLVFWPLDQREWISNYSSVFNGVEK
jgi:signal peptidase I